MNEKSKLLMNEINNSLMQQIGISNQFFIKDVVLWKDKRSNTSRIAIKPDLFFDIWFESSDLKIHIYKEKEISFSIVKQHKKLSKEEVLEIIEAGESLKERLLKELSYDNFEERDLSFKMSDSKGFNDLYDLKTELRIKAKLADVIKGKVLHFTLNQIIQTLIKDATGLKCSFEDVHWFSKGLMETDFNIIIKPNKLKISFSSEMLDYFDFETREEFEEKKELVELMYKQ